MKVFLNEARERGLNTSPEYRSKRFRVLREDVDKIYLNSDDLDALWNLKLVDNSKLGKVRDVFLIGCYTGLRYSDLRNLRPENVLEKKNIRLKTIKGDKLVVMPIHYRVKLILEKNDWNFPAVISNQKMNEYLKVLGKLAKISESVIIPIKKGNMRTDVTHFKYALISSHTARRSFATNAFLDGVEPLHIMRITGHRTEKAFLRYIRMSEMDNAIKLADHPFFNAPLKLVQQK
ncbi:MAG: integrase catalytic domain-containing protein [Bacteroidetes bacterium]|nr:integrase catalytic domain-containing protein [Bacteroidota bacterium]